MRALIVGGGTTVYFLCRDFASKGHEVVVVNRDERECVRLARQLPATVVCGDGSDASVLGDAGARSADVVLALTPNDQDNLVICQLASLQFGVPRTLALANDPDNVAVLHKLGVPAFSMTDVVSTIIEQRATTDQITNLLPVGEGRVIVTEVRLDDASPALGRSLEDVALPANALVAAIMRDDDVIVPHGSSCLNSGDRLLLVTQPDNHAAVLRALTGERR